MAASYRLAALVKTNRIPQAKVPFFTSFVGVTII
jgi:hypothetical protein